MVKDNHPLETTYWSGVITSVWVVERGGFEWLLGRQGIRRYKTVPVVGGGFS